MSDKQPNPPLLYSVEGNIGAGKTTFLRKIEEKLCEQGRTDIRVIYEPVDAWSNVKDAEQKTILHHFYENPAKYAFPFQIMAFTSRLHLIQQEIAKYPDCKIFLCERSLDADANVFAKMLYEDGLMENMLYQIYRQLYENHIGQYAAHTIIYLRMSPAVCMERVGIRQRQGEATISLEYLQKCHDYHEGWLLNESNESNQNKILLENDKEIENFIQKWVIE
jgi:deoxycitidine kinase/deoxyguanosine kinase